MLVGLSLWSFFVRALLGLLNQKELFGFYNVSFEKLAYYLLALAFVITVLGEKASVSLPKTRKR